MHALIIEDESLIAMSLEQILSDCGFTSFDVASSFDEAVRAAELRCPDLITADGQLCPGSGIDAVNAIRSSTPVPVIFITATPTEVVSRMPNHPLIVKPFSSEDVASAVNLVMADRQKLKMMPVTNISVRSKAVASRAPGILEKG